MSWPAIIHYGAMGGLFLWGVAALAMIARLMNERDRLRQRVADLEAGQRRTRITYLGEHEEAGHGKEHRTASAGK